MDPKIDQPKARACRHLVLPGNESSLVLEALARRTWWEPTKGGDLDWDFWWGGNGQKFPFDLMRRGRGGKGPSVFNKIENHREVCTKTGLARTIRECALRRKRLPPWAPETFIFPNYGSLADELPELKKAYKRHAEATRGGGGGRVWILKPAAMNRGKGIHIFDTWRAIESFLRARVASEPYIAQKYIENPLLIDGRKFDIRVYALVTTSPSPKVFLHPDGYIRTCGVEYDSSDVGESALAGHLTNDAVQKCSETYGSFEDHNKLSFTRFQDKLRSCGEESLKDFDFSNQVFSQVERCTEELFRVALRRMRPKMEGSFELFGLDFMVDDSLRVSLVEVNTSPALFRKGAHLQTILPGVVEEALQKALDPYFPPPPGASAPDRLDKFKELQIR